MGHELLWVLVLLTRDVVYHPPEVQGRFVTYDACEKQAKQSSKILPNPGPFTLKCTNRGYTRDELDDPKTILTWN